MIRKKLNNLLTIITILFLSFNCFKKTNSVDRTKATPKLAEFPTITVGKEEVELKETPSIVSKSISILLPGSNVTLKSSEGILNYIGDRVDMWIKIETNDKILGWSLSSKFTQHNNNISLIDFGDKCDIEIGNFCYFNNLEEDLCEKVNDKCEVKSNKTIQFNDYVKIEKISEKNNFVFVTFYNGNYKSGWIESNTLVSTNQLNIENPLAKKTTDSKDIEKSMERINYSIIRNSTNPIFLKGYKYPNSTKLDYNTYFASKGELIEDKNILFGEIIYGKSSRSTRPAFLPKNVLVESEILENTLEKKFPELSILTKEELITTKYPTNVCYTNETDKFNMFGFSSIRTGASHLTYKYDLITVEKVGDTFYLISSPEYNKTNDNIKIAVKIISKDRIQINDDIFIPIKDHPTGPCPYENFYSDD